MARSLYIIIVHNQYHQVRKPYTLNNTISSRKERMLFIKYEHQYPLVNPSIHPQETHFVRVQTYRWSDNARQCQCRFEKNLDFLLKGKTKGVNVSKAYFGGPNPDKITKFKFWRRIQLWNSFFASINIKSNSLLDIDTELF